MPEQSNPFAPGGGGVFQVQPSDLMAMLQTAFPTAPPPTRMAMPDTSAQPETQMIDLGAGGQRPGTRQSAIGNLLGSAVSAAGQLYGANAAQNAAKNAQADMNIRPHTTSSGQNIEIMNVGGTPGSRGYAVTFPTLPPRR